VPADNNAISSFKLSRVFAEGWNAARNLAGGDELNREAIAGLNPYADEPARSRWIEGFTKAQDE
jgi:hypothetical protein